MQHGRRKRSERFAELDLHVHDRLHVAVAGVAEMLRDTERTRPELAPPLEPADDLAVRHQARSTIDERLVIQPLVGRACPVEKPPYSVVGEARPEERAAPSVVWLRRARLAEQLVPDSRPLQEAIRRALLQASVSVSYCLPILHPNKIRDVFEAPCGHHFKALREEHSSHRPHQEQDRVAGRDGGDVAP